MRVPGRWWRCFWCLASSLTCNSLLVRIVGWGGGGGGGVEEKEFSRITCLVEISLEPGKLLLSKNSHC